MHHHHGELVVDPEPRHQRGDGRRKKQQQEVPRPLLGTAQREQGQRDAGIDQAELDLIGVGPLPGLDELVEFLDPLELLHPESAQSDGDALERHLQHPEPLVGEDDHPEDRDRQEPEVELRLGPELTGRLETLVHTSFNLVDGVCNFFAERRIFPLLSRSDPLRFPCIVFVHERPLSGRDLRMQGDDIDLFLFRRTAETSEREENAESEDEPSEDVNDLFHG